MVSYRLGSGECRHLWVGSLIGDILVNIFSATKTCDIGVSVFPVCNKEIPPTPNVNETCPLGADESRTKWTRLIIRGKEGGTISFSFFYLHKFIT